MEALIKTNPRIRGRGNAARSLFRDNKTVARYRDGEAACHAMRMPTEEWIMKHLSKRGETNFYYLHRNVFHISNHRNNRETKDKEREREKRNSMDDKN